MCCTYAAGINSFNFDYFVYLYYQKPPGLGGFSLVICVPCSMALDCGTSRLLDREFVGWLL